MSVQARELALDCYLEVLRNIAHYAVELDPATTALHRKYLEDPGGRATYLREPRRS